MNKVYLVFGKQHIYQSTIHILFEVEFYTLLGQDMQDWQHHDNNVVRNPVCVLLLAPINSDPYLLYYHLVPYWQQNIYVLAIHTNQLSYC